ncbi:DUF550 domain-containing protein [Salmonella enterica subsp. enterica serovar Mississippi]|nr:DUF550 domain-containing protein [Salmonella enterica]EDV5650205.1 DUF550 domain-containing protein [Salmonella enterica subsp. enterica]EGI5663937.1 DUF550 domain-containing protein [Salmonella enterica subsp. enterica serovar Mississippi]
MRELQERRKADNQEPASERERIRREHAEWSDATFGEVGPIGPLKHLSKEALEAAADPSDPLEWADMQFLLWDAQRRMGISDEFITRAMIEKLEINKSRQWPEPKDGEPRLHIKEQPAPVVPDEWTIQDAVKFCRETGRQDAGSAMEAWNACRAAMLQGSQPVSDRDELPCAQVKAVADLYALCWQSGEVVTYTPDSEKAAIWLNNYSGTCVQEYVTLEQFQGVVSGNSPVTPDGWIKCSDLTPETGQAVIGCVDFDSDIVTPLVREFIWTGSTFRRGVSSTGVKSNDSIVVTHWMPLPAAPKKD